MTDQVSATRYTIAVRALCAFTAKSGDLDLRFTPGPSAEDGMAGHALVRSRRATTYQAEVALEADFEQLRVRGRADGYDPEHNRVEEIKTYRGDLGRMADNHRQLHWAQAKIYAYLLCLKFSLSAIEVALVYLEISEQTETVFSEPYSCIELQQFFEQQCRLFLACAERELQHRQARDAALRTLKFPHAGFRTGQRELAQAVYRAANQNRCLMAQAPTGTGKTIATLFPLLKAMPGSASKPLDKIFYLAAKTSGRQLAINAVALITNSGPELGLRTLELIARDKACEYPDRACHGESCPLAQGFYDRLPAARQALMESGNFERTNLRASALQHQICPYYLSQEMVRWSDVVIGDYNYYFDSSALLHGLMVSHQWQVGVLVDEAHNLVERARKMYSAELDQGLLQTLREHPPAGLKASLSSLQRSWNALTKQQQTSYQTYASVPERFIFALQKTCAVIGDYLVAQADIPAPALQQFYFAAQQFCRLSEVFGEHSLFDITLAQGKSRTALLCLRNVVPAPFLKARFTALRSATLFSATLGPWQYYSDLLGTPADTPWIEVASPFDPAQLTVQVAAHISTRYHERSQSLLPIARLMAEQFAAQPGNYFAFFSSFEYLQNALAVLRTQAPQVPVWVQERSMDEVERDRFLARFEPGGTGIGFAVLGGAFAEGVDLPGDRLIGAFIATLGLPQTNAINEKIRLRMQALFGQGYAYTYLYPGLQKVVQAAGRVIRNPTDRGWIFLMDDRFAQTQVQQLLPQWWPRGLQAIG